MVVFIVGSDWSRSMNGSLFHSLGNLLKVSCVVVVGTDVNELVGGS